MARRKRTSQVLEKAVRRAAGMSSIAPALDLGNGLTLPSFSTLIETMQAKENAYNSALSNLDKLYREMLETERDLGDMAEHMLLGVATKYGKSSVEYGMAGGVPKTSVAKDCAVSQPHPVRSNPPLLPVPTVTAAQTALPMARLLSQRLRLCVRSRLLKPASIQRDRPLSSLMMGDRFV